MKRSFRKMFICIFLFCPAYHQILLLISEQNTWAFLSEIWNNVIWIKLILLIVLSKRNECEFATNICAKCETLVIYILQKLNQGGNTSNGCVDLFCSLSLRKRYECEFEVNVCRNTRFSYLDTNVCSKYETLMIYILQQNQLGR